jgi:hypothetical protein
MRASVHVTLFIALCIGCVATGQNQRPHADARKRSAAHSVHRRVTLSPARCLLLRCVQRIEWDDAPFEEILDWLRRQAPAGAKVNVIPKWRALGRAGVNGDTPVTLEMEQVSVGAVLEEVLAQMSGADPLTFVGQGNILRITTQSDLRGRLYTRIYDVGEIIAHGRADRVSPRFIAGQQVAVGTAFANIGGTGVRTGALNIGVTMFGEDQEDEEDQEDVAEEVIAELIHMIQTTVEPSTWAVNGGRGTLSVVDGMLVVRNSADVHALLGGSFRIE